MHILARVIFPDVRISTREALQSSTVGLELIVLLLLRSGVYAPPPDARTDYSDPTHTYNLDPTGARGSIYNTGNGWLSNPERLTTGSRQILVTHVEAGSPADDLLQVDDVIRGVRGTAADPGDFTSDARKTIGWVISEAEKAVKAGKLTITPGTSSDQVSVRRSTLGTSGCLRLPAPASQRPLISRNPPII